MCVLCVCVCVFFFFFGLVTSQKTQKASSLSSFFLETFVQDRPCSSLSYGACGGGLKNPSRFGRGTWHSNENDEDAQGTKLFEFKIINFYILSLLEFSGLSARSYEVS